MRYHVKEWVFPLGDNFTIRDDSGNVLYEVKNRLISIGDHFFIYDGQTKEQVLHIKQRVFSPHTTQYELIQNGTEIATLRRKTEATHGARFEIVTRDSLVLQIRGNFKDWDYDIVDQYGQILAHISREFAIFGGSYTVDVSPRFEGPLMVAVAIILDEIREDGGKD